MGITKIKECPRKAALAAALSSGENKSIQLHKAMLEAMDCPYSISLADLEDRIDTAFVNADVSLPAFERDAEKTRMSILLMRYFGYEEAQPHNEILAKDFSGAVSLFGESTFLHADRLVDRGDFTETIRYMYRKPDLSYAGKSCLTKAGMNPDLLALQKLGELISTELGIDKPVHAAFYYLRSKADMGSKIALEFEQKRGYNIITNHFTPEDAGEIEKEFGGIHADTHVITNNASTCQTCRFQDICQTVFVKRQEQQTVTEESAAPLDSVHLTPAQLRFAEFQSGQCRVNAVAGSGKTSVVVLRTLRLLTDGCNPECILMITFTDKARAEMRERLTRFAQGRVFADLGLNTDAICVETFNSFGQKILEENYEKLGFTSTPELVDEITRKDIIISILNQHPSLSLDYTNPFMNLPTAQGAVVELGNILQSMKANHVETELNRNDMDILREYTDECAGELLDVYAEYNQKLLELNRIEYDDQLRLLLKLKDFGVFETLPYRHIIVDEFQDSNRVQIEMILEMFQRCRPDSLVVVGDELQSIYSFRNSTPENLVNFRQYFPNMVDMPLEDNFRSTPSIITAANHILDRKSKIAKSIRAARPEEGVPPCVRLVEKEAGEQSLFVRQTEKLIRDGLAPSDICIMCRTRKELAAMQSALTVAGVPVTLQVPETMGDTPYVKAVLGLAAFLKNHENMTDLAMFYKSLGGDPLDTAALKEDAMALAGRWDSSTEDERREMFENLTLDAKGDRVAAAFLEDLNAQTQNTQEAIEFCCKYKLYGIREAAPVLPNPGNAVTLITVHSAKGLEWPVVLLSLRKFHVTERDIDEEARLLYVAVTRAREKLLVTYTKKTAELAEMLKG